MSHLLTNYQPLAVHFTHGEGCWLYDTQGKRYLDAIAGLAVSTLGHQHPALIDVLQSHASRPLQLCNLYTIPEQETLATLLCKHTGLSHAYFCNSGAEANEAAIKFARLLAHQRGITTPTILTMTNSFHGRTFGAASATNNRKVQQHIGPLLSGFEVCEYNNIDAVRAHSNNPSVVAVMLETIQGDGGINMADHDYLRNVRALCDTQNWLLITDEIQAGCGRTGTFCGFHHATIQPDIVTLSKGLGGGFPVGACLTNATVAKAVTPGCHGSTFGGNPLACRMAHAVVNTVVNDGLMDNATRQGNYLLKHLNETLTNHPLVHSIRGKGLMIGIELHDALPNLTTTALEHGLLLNVTQQKIIRVLPPLIIDHAACDYLVDTLATVLGTYA